MRSVQPRGCQTCAQGRQDLPARRAVHGSADSEHGSAVKLQFAVEAHPRVTSIGEALNLRTSACQHRARPSGIV